MPNRLVNVTRAAVRMAQAVACMVCATVALVSIVVHANTVHAGSGPLGFLSKIVPAVTAELRFAFGGSPRGVAARELIAIDPGLGAWSRGAALWLAGNHSAEAQLAGAAALVRANVGVDTAVNALIHVLSVAPERAVAVAAIGRTLPPARHLSLANRFDDRTVVNAIGAAKAAQLGLSIARTPALFRLAGVAAERTGAFDVALRYYQQAQKLSPEDPNIAGDVGTVAATLFFTRGGETLRRLAWNRLSFAVAHLESHTPYRVIKALRSLTCRWARQIETARA